MTQPLGGKFDLVVLKDGLVLSNAKNGNLRLSSSSVTSVVILDNIPKDTKGRVLLLLALDKAAGLMHGKTKLEAVVLQILDNIPKDTKGRVLLLLALDKAAGLMHGKTKLEAVVLQ
ncbi:secretory carrier-associated membrane protein, partial [Haematococcus lacustris]